MDAKTILGDIGLTKNEVRIYLSLMELGSTTTGAIIKKTKIHNSKVYDGLSRLADKGLVSYVIIAGSKHFKAVDPERLVDFLNEKRKKIDLEEGEIKKILPELKLKQQLVPDDTQAEIFTGWKGMETVYKMLRQSLKKGDVNYVFGASKGEDEEMSKIFFTRHLRQFAKQKVRLKIIYNESLRGNVIDESLVHKDLFKIRYLLNTTPAEINVWRDKVMIVILRKSPTVILVNDGKVADSFRTYFEIMWNMAKE